MSVGAAITSSLANVSSSPLTGFGLVKITRKVLRTLFFNVVLIAQAGFTQFLLATFLCFLPNYVFVTPYRLLTTLSILVITLAAKSALSAPPMQNQPLSGLAALLLGTVRGMPTGMTGVTRLTAGDPDRELRLACQELKRAGPVDLDDTTRFDGCVTRPGKIVEFQLKVAGVDASRDGTREYMDSIKPILERGICRNPDVPVLGKLGVTLRYHYTAGRQSLVRLNIVPNQCQRQ